MVLLCPWKRVGHLWLTRTYNQWSQSPVLIKSSDVLSAAYQFLILISAADGAVHTTQGTARMKLTAKENWKWCLQDLDDLITDETRQDINVSVLKWARLHRPSVSMGSLSSDLKLVMSSLPCSFTSGPGELLTAKAEAAIYLWLLIETCLRRWL